MTTYTSHYPPAHNDTYVKATSSLGGDYYPYNATNPAKSVVDGPAGNQWYAGSAVTRKFNIDLGESLVIKRLYLENAHESGLYTIYGVREILVYGTNSADAFANVDYATTTDLVLIATLEAAQHVAANSADPQYFLLTNSTAYRYMVVRIATNWGATFSAIRRIVYQTEDTAPVLGRLSAFFDQTYDLEALIIRQAIDQLYALPFFVSAAIDQIYGLKLTALFAQYYGDTPTIAKHLIQYYGDAATVKRAVVQMYGDALAICKIIEQPYSLPAHLAAFIEQKYNISGAELRLVVEQLWALKGTDAVRAILEQPFGILADPAQILTYTVAVLAGEVAIDPLHVNIEGSQDQFCLSCEIHCGSQADYLACTVGSNLEVIVNAQTFNFFIESRDRNRGHGTAEYIIKGLSRSALLDAPYADTISGELTGMASAIVAGLAPDFVIHWHTVDWFIPANTLLPADQTPLAIIRDIAHAAGAIVQTELDGSITIEPLYRTAVNRWGTATVDHQLSDSLDFFSTSETFEHRPGYNRYQISDQLTSETTSRLDPEIISETVQEIRGYKTPWVDDLSLRHSGGDWVTIEAMGLETIDKIEVVEFVAGEGRTQYPIYGIGELAWLQSNLGSVTHAEDGRLLAAVTGESLLSITYQTKCRKWRATNPRSEQVQFISDEVSA